MKKLLILTIFLVSWGAFAQEKIPVKDTDYTNNAVEMADLMRSEGKIYVLVGIILIIFIGIIVYLFTIDRKISQVEKNLPQIK